MARPKGYKKKNYYTRKDIKANAKNASITIDKNTGQKLIQNVYVHSGLYNFSKVVKDYQYGTGNFISSLSKKLESDFNRQITLAKKREKEIYEMTYPSLDNAKAMKQYLTYDSMALEVLNSLNFYTLLDEALANYSENKTSVNISEFQNKFSEIFSAATNEATKKLSSEYANAFNTVGGLDIYKYTKACKEKEMTLKEIKKSPSKIFNISQMQGDLGEIAALLDQIGKNTADNVFTTELKKGLLKTKNITIKGLGEINAKSDIGVEGKTINFGIQIKNYKDPFSAIGIHKGNNKLSDLFGTNVLEQANKDLKLSTIFKDLKGTPKDFERFLQYCIINAQSFKSSGVYLTRSSKKSNNSNSYSTYNAFNKEVSFIMDYVNYLAAYWIGTKVINSEKNNKSVAFYYLNDQIIPISEILKLVRNGIKNKKYVITPKFSNIKVFTPSVLKQEKWDALKKNGYYSNWDHKKRYPEPLLRIGSAIGKNSLDDITFNIEMKLKGLF